ncbi:MAG: ribonuclease III [Gemmatimonadetes bacterium]|nr:ribonuclease III [Gemmatimonadota bacterium]
MSKRHSILQKLGRAAAVLFSGLKRGVSGHAANRTAIERENARQVQKYLNYRFKNTDYLITALKHRSYVYSREQSGVHSNERLEFLGDAVLDLVVGEFIFNTYPRRREGQLTQLRSTLVNRKALARQARAMKLGRYVLLSPSEARSGGRFRHSILSDAYESIIGAMYLDGGLQPVRRFLHRTLLQDLGEERPASVDHSRNYKSALLEYTQGEGIGQPEYRVDSAVGPDHEKVFTIEVYVSGNPVSKGTGTSKKNAEQDAARQAVEQLQAARNSDRP